MGDLVNNQSGDYLPHDADTTIEPGEFGRHRWWRVGTDRVELSPSASGWDVRVQQRGWDDVTLKVDGHFGDEAEAIAWCEKMAEVLARDLADDDDLVSGSGLTFSR
jgi:hypothetical protein